MTRTILVNEIDRVLAESRAILFAMREGFAVVEVLNVVRVEGAWEVHVDLSGPSATPRVRTRPIT